MAYLNQSEREKLLNDLKGMKFNRAKGKLRRMDAKGNMAYFRNAQAAGKLYTRFELYGLGTVVTLVEQEIETRTTSDAAGAAAVRMKSEFQMTEVMVEPMPENRT